MVGKNKDSKVEEARRQVRADLPLRIRVAGAIELNGETVHFTGKVVDHGEGSTPGGIEQFVVVATATGTEYTVRPASVRALPKLTPARTAALLAIAGNGGTVSYDLTSIGSIGVHGNAVHGLRSIGLLGFSGSRLALTTDGELIAGALAAEAA